MYARIRLREWEAQKEFALFALKYANKFANYFWLFGKITLGFA